jgi:hypothetical protein
METSSSPLMLIGALLFLVSVLTAVILIAVSSRLAMGYAGWHNMGAFFKQRKAAKTVLMLAICGAGLGGMVTCGSVMAGDQQRNARCSAACQTAGFSQPGRYRASPHRKFKPGDKYACWCQDGNAWSAEPVDF